MRISHVIRLLMLVVAINVLPVMGAEPKETIMPDDVIVYKKVKTEKGTFDLKLHVFNPQHANVENRPCVLVIHGGGWNNGTPESTYKTCERYADLGLVAIAIEYRVRDVHGGTPLDSVRDAKSAMRWIRSHADALGIDPEKIVAQGGSAGGHLAAACAFLSAFDEEVEGASFSSCRPNALILVSPVLDNSPNGYGHYHKAIKENWKDFSPLHNISDWAPPTIMFVGDQEPKHLPVESAKTFQKKVKATGSACELFVLEGATHYTRTKAHGDTIQREEKTFLATLGYID